MYNCRLLCKRKLKLWWQIVVYLVGLAKGKRKKKWQLNDMAAEREQGANAAAQLRSTTLHVSSWTLFKQSPDLSGCSTVCFPLQRGDGFGQGWQWSLFSPPGSLEWRAGKLKTGFTRFLETVKQAGGPTVRERGRERLCDKEYTWRERERER